MKINAEPYENCLLGVQFLFVNTYVPYPFSRCDEGKLMKEEQHLLSAVEENSVLDDSKAEALEEQAENDVQENENR